MVRQYWNKGVDAARGVWQVFFNACRNPLCAIRRHGLDGCTLRLSQAFHKPREHLLPVSFASPHDGVCLVVHDDGDVLVPLAVAGLIDAVADQAIEAFAGVWFEILVHTMDAAPDRITFDAHVGCDSVLAQLQCHPRHHHVERLSEVGMWERQWHTGGMNAMLGA